MTGRRLDSLRKRRERVAELKPILSESYPDLTVSLDWNTPLQLLVATILSAQCTDERVNRVTPALFARASTPHDMAQVPVPEILEFIRSCGLAPSKARAIQGLSRVIVREHAGRVPEDFEALEALPGVGHKTASVVRVQAFGHPAFPVDTHIHRLAGRWGLSRARNVAMTERDLKTLFAEEDWGAVHLQLIYFGREYCPARGHDFAACPICAWAASKARIAGPAWAALNSSRRA